MCYSSKAPVKFGFLTRTVEQTQVCDTMNTQGHTHKLNANENLTQLSNEVLFRCPQYPGDGLLQSYRAIRALRVMGLAGLDKRNPDEMNHVGTERRELLSADGRSPVTLRGDAVTLWY